ncbi:hypothetical protein JW859_10005 [bacterium]|nr:hypothetical protein [bacterium]
MRLNGTLIAVLLIMLAAPAAWADAGDTAARTNPPESTVPESYSFNDNIVITQNYTDQTPWFYFVYDRVGIRAPVEQIPGGGVLEYAAHCYALLTGDYDVSLSDLIEAGLWPYDTFPANVDLEMRLYDIDTHSCSPWDEQRQCPAVIDLGTPKWLANSRTSILAMFYGDYFYSIIDFRHERTAEIGDRYPQFWTNPYTGKPLDLSADSEDVRFYEVKTWRENAGLNCAELYKPGEEADWFTFAEFRQLIEAQNETDAKQLSYQLNLKLLPLDPPSRGIVKGSCIISSHLEQAYRSLLGMIVRRSMEDQGKLDFDFTVPQFDLYDYMLQSHTSE